MIIGALFTIIQFEYYPWVPEFWVPNPHGYPRVIPKKTQNFELYGYPTRKYPWNSDTNPTQPIPKIWFGSGYYPWVPKFWVPNPHHNTLKLAKLLFYIIVCKLSVSLKKLYDRQVDFKQE